MAGLKHYRVAVSIPGCFNLLLIRYFVDINTLHMHIGRGHSSNLIVPNK